MGITLRHQAGLVSQESLHLVEINPPLYQSARKRMAQIVESEVQEVRSITSLCEGASEIANLQGISSTRDLLLLESEGPLVLDQPEDNLDNRFISEGVVPKIRSEKRRRQFIFSTHNANIPVLGDAELILVMRAIGEAGDGHADVPVENMGSIDKESVAALVEEILEGGREAFETRRLKYGFQQSD